MQPDQPPPSYSERVLGVRVLVPDTVTDEQLDTLLTGAVLQLDGATVTGGPDVRAAFVAAPTTEGP